MSKHRKAQNCQDVNSLQLALYIQCNLNQNPSNLFCEYWQINSNAYLERKKSQNTNTRLKNNKVGRLKPLDIKTYYKATIIKLV